MATTYDKIATTTLSSATATITFSSIASTYTDLRFSLSVITANAGNQIFMRFNSDTGSNYSRVGLYGDGSSAGSFAVANQTYIFLNSNGLSTTIPSFYTVDVFSYAGSTFKTSLITSSEDRNGSGSTIQQVGLWRSTSAINNVSFTTDTGNWAAGTTATLYGILKA
jgi:hypothetical protein